MNKLKCILVLLAVLAFTSPLTAQQSVTQVGNINAASTACATAASCVTLATSPNSGAVAIQIAGTFNAVLQFEGSVDGNTFVSVSGMPSSGGLPVTLAGGGGIWQVDATGASYIRVRCSSYISGAAQITLTSGNASPVPEMQPIMGTFGTPVGSDGWGLKVSPPLSPDPCLTQVSTDVAVSQTATTKNIAGRPAMRIYVCQVRLVVGAAEITSELEGSGTTCGTGTIAHSGSTTAANGESFAANGGYSTTKTFSLIPGNDFCIGQSGSNRVSGKISFVYAP